MTHGLIFDIKKYSIHDGPGIRTTVFFKGCPLELLVVPQPGKPIVPTRSHAARQSLHSLRRVCGRVSA